MTKTELQDNLVFLSALKLLEQLTKKGLLTVDEAEKSRVEQAPPHSAVRLNRPYARIADCPVFPLLFRWCW